MGRSLGTHANITRWKRVGSGSAVDGEPSNRERSDEFIRAFMNDLLLNLKPARDKGFGLFKKARIDYYSSSRN
jgi:hypothetical protein